MGMLSLHFFNYICIPNYKGSYEDGFLISGFAGSRCIGLLILLPIFLRYSHAKEGAGVIIMWLAEFFALLAFGLTRSPVIFTIGIFSC